MAVRSLNKVQLIGNLTRDPELRYTPNGTAVCSFTVATNREWTVESGEKREEAEFTRIVSWNKLAELCSQLLLKGRKVYVEGRLQTRSWTGQDGNQRQSTEVVISDMIILDSKRVETIGQSTSQPSGVIPVPPSVVKPAQTVQSKKTAKDDKKNQDDKKSAVNTDEDSKKEEQNAVSENEQVNPDDIPF